ncbi:DUF4286 family protein [Paracoccus sp. pheM1]|uniref:DUF4286 family protein n=1 Tax=Paracoccus sp. pheM1 TaxID=2831675 RepID=UPI001BDB76B4|nr:DUF4286 family protein [Paracoccus sp. pheM1]MBT0781216.1 hypothetical protein [Paracoccus sp. pheM1]
MKLLQRREDEMPRFDFIVFTNCKEGTDDEFNDWYTHQHLQDVMRIPGVVSSQRFKRSEHQRDPGPFEWNYLAIYNCDTDDVQDIIGQIRARVNTDAMPISDTLAEKRFFCVFEPITDMQYPKE